MPILPPSCQSRRLLAAGQCSGSQRQKQLEQALASLPRTLLMLPCALTPSRVLGFTLVHGQSQCPCGPGVYISVCWQRMGPLLPQA